MTELARVPDPEPAAEVFLSGRMSRRHAGYSPGTRRTYKAALAAFATFVRSESPTDALEAFLRLPQAQAHDVALRWRAAMVEAGLSSASVNLRLAVIRAATRAAYTHGECSFILDVPSIQHEPRRSRIGPSWALICAMIEQEPSARNRAFLALLSQRGLRCAEALGLHREHVGKDCATVSLLGKARREREVVTLAPDTAAHLRAWLKDRGDSPGPLFPFKVSMAAKLTKLAGDRVGIAHMSPHLARHSFGTLVAQKCGGDVSLVASLLRHKDWKSSAFYVDDVKQRANDLLVRVLPHSAG